jgi:hypothetical protein
MPNFWVVITASGVLGLAISFTSMWFLHQTSATTYRCLMGLNFKPQIWSRICFHINFQLWRMSQASQSITDHSTIRHWAFLKCLLFLFSTWVPLCCFWCKCYFSCSLVGSLNKIPLSIAGIVLFNVRTSMENSLSILFGRSYLVMVFHHFLCMLCMTNNLKHSIM